jgi:hypothetical protein
VIIQKRIHRGAFQLFIRSMTRWSRLSMYPQTVFAPTMAAS